ncbi:MAG: hypothetical protein EP349_01000, partial [Alphaproteobacteria bacterium]
MDNPSKIVSGSNDILDASNQWPNFHDAEVRDFSIVRGEVNPDKGLYTGPQITTRLMLCALKEPYEVIFTFQDCQNIVMADFGNQNPIMDLTIELEERGYLTDGNKMSPYIVVNFLPVLPDG